MRKIKDITGLCDGQTIHLVKKRDTSSANNNNNSSSSSNTGGDATSSAAASRRNGIGRGSIEADTLSGSSDGSGGGALLAALLGLGSLSDEARGGGTTNNGGTTTNTTTAASPLSSSWRPSRRSHRRPHYRLSATDLQVPDPGSMEPVRQGLMTLHTLLPHSQLCSEDGVSPLEANREWFRGQWIDVRDTVNQWLEATVVEVLQPEDVLPDVIPRTSSSALGLYPPHRRRSPNVDNDPAISGNDLEGRRRLLLEPCEPGDPQELSGDLIGFRPRSNNQGVQLLLVHYNGWPPRWDEWIRSDSERIRPFRTRTRHPNMSSTASPTPQSVFTDAPRTNIRDGDELADREALLPELNRALSQVSSLLGELVQRGRHDEEDGLEELPGNSSTGRQRRAQEDLPWMARAGFSVASDDGELSSTGMADSIEDQEQDTTALSNIMVPEEDDSAGGVEGVSLISENQVPFGPAPRPMYNQRELRNLATILDRLGRTLTDAAPHVASLAASLPDQTTALNNRQTPNATESESATEVETTSAPLGGLLSLWSRERRRQATNDENVEAAPTAPVVVPDHVDYASGLVNTTRGEVRSGPRSRSSSQDDVANLLGAYLAAASLGGLTSSDDDNDDGSGLGRLLARGGTGGSGIDIHIHAVVTTGGGGGTGGTGLLGLGGGLGGGGLPTGTLGATTNTNNNTRNLFSSSRGSRPGGSILRSRNNVAAETAMADTEDDNDDLFSELYSENPAPIDPNGTAGPGERSATVDSPPRNIGDTNSDFSSRNLMEDQTFGSATSWAASQNTQRNPPRRQSADRRSGVFRLFRRRSRSNQNGPRNEESD